MVKYCIQRVKIIHSPTGSNNLIIAEHVIPVENFQSEDYLFLTHLDEYTAAKIPEKEVIELLQEFSGEIFLINEFSRNGEKQDNHVHGQNHVPPKNHLQTKVGLGEPIDVPENQPETAYFGGFNMAECMATSIGKIAESFGETTEYAILEDYTLHGHETLEKAISGEEKIEEIEDLIEPGYVEPREIQEYPENTRITNSGI